MAHAIMHGAATSLYFGFHSESASSRSCVFGPAMAAHVVLPPRTRQGGYSLRPLAGEHEIDAWSELCAACFLRKQPMAPPASYFKGHFTHDPTRNYRGVFVAEYAGTDASGGATTALVASVSWCATRPYLLHP